MAGLNVIQALTVEDSDTSLRSQLSYIIDTSNEVCFEEEHSSIRINDRNEVANIRHDRRHYTDVLQQKYGISQSVPKHAKFAIKSTRESSFHHFPSIVTQTAKEFAEAGFFYTGEDDIVICYYCGQGLRSWEPGDDVWVEHARWSPQCVHLQNCKGKPFIQMIVEDKKQLESTENNSTSTSSSNSPKLSDKGTQKGACAITKDVKTKCKDGPGIDLSDLLQTVAAKSIIQNGYGKQTVMDSIRIFVKKKGQTNFNSTDLMEIILDLEDGVIKPEKDFLAHQESSNLRASKNTSSELHQESFMEAKKTEAKLLIEENRQLKEQTVCKICLEETMSMVFLPCGHLCCCSQCAPALRKCPICRIFIKGTVKTYLN